MTRASDSPELAPASAGTRGSKVSLVVVAHNGAEYLPDAIRSCLAQSHADIEVVVVEPAAQASLSLPEGDDRVRRILVRPDASWAAAANAGLQAARGDHLMCLTDTDRLQPWAIERLLGTLHSTTLADGVYTSYQIRELSTGSIEERRASGDVNEALLTSNDPYCLFTRAAYGRVGGFRERCAPAERLDHTIRLFGAGTACHLPDIALEHVVFPWRTKDPDWVLLGLMGAAVRWTHHLVSAESLRPWLRRYMAEVWKKPGGWRELPRWYAVTGKRLARLSPTLGVYWSIASCSLISERAQTGPVSLPDWERYAKARQRARHALSLRAWRPLRHRAGTQVLCLVPKVVIGGSEKVVRDVVVGLNSRGFRFHLLAERGDQNSWCRAFRDAFDNVVEVDIPGNEVPEDPAAYLGILLHLVRKLDVELIMISNAFPAYAVLPELRAAMPKLPVVDLLHVEQYSGMSPAFLDRAKYIERRICISDHLRALMTTHYAEGGIDPLHVARLDVILNGHDLSRFDPETVSHGDFRLRTRIPANAIVITTVARLEREKRPQLFVDIAQRLCAAHPELPLYFVMAGDGRERPRVERRITAHGLDDRFRLLGGVAYEEVPELLQDTDLMLIASLMEGLPLVMVEALSMDVPVVATDVGGIGQVIVPGENGYLVSPKADDLAGAFARAVEPLLRDPNERRAMAARCRATVVERFAMQRMHERYAKVFQELIPHTPRETNGPVARAPAE